MNTYHWKWEALWTHRHISYKSDEESHFSTIIELMQSFENMYSRFDATSSLSVLNNKKHISAHEELVDIVYIWLDAHQKTDGYFSLCVWTVLTNLWYDKDYSFQVKENQKKMWEHISIHNWEITLWEDTTIDLWWLWKWYLIDKIGKYFNDNSITNRIINGGWDIAVQQENLVEFWNIWLQHTTKKEILIWEVALKQWAITCSSSHERKRWEHHHLINPKAWKPVQNRISSIYVYSDTATIADIASTTLCVCWEENIPYYAQILWVEYIIVYEDDTIIHSRHFPNIHLY